MGTPDSKHSHHSHHHSRWPHHHHHNHFHDHSHTDEDGHCLSKEVPLSRKSKLIIRLKNIINHNREHEASYRWMADEARELGATASARYILEVAGQIISQNETLVSALTSLHDL